MAQSQLHHTAGQKYTLIELSKKRRRSRKCQNCKKRHLQTCMEQLHGIFQQDHKKYYKGSRAKIVPQMSHLCIQMQNDHDRCTHDRRRKGRQEAVSDQHHRHHPKVQPSFFSSPEFSQNAVQDPDMQSADCQDMSCPVALKLFSVSSSISVFRRTIYRASALLRTLQRYPSAGADIAPFAETATLAKNDFLLLYG